MNVPSVPEGPMHSCSSGSFPPTENASAAGLCPRPSPHSILLPRLTSPSWTVLAIPTFIYLDQVSSEFQMHISTWVSYRNCKLVLPSNRTFIFSPESALSHLLSLPCPGSSLWQIVQHNSMSCWFFPNPFVSIPVTLRLSLPQCLLPVL